MKTLRERACDDALAVGLLTAEECAALLHVKTQTVRLWVCQRRIPFYKVGRCVRFSRAKMVRWLEEQECAPAPCYVVGGGLA